MLGTETVVSVLYLSMVLFLHMGGWFCFSVNILRNQIIRYNIYISIQVTYGPTKLLLVPGPWSCQVTAGPRTMVLPSYCRSQDHGPTKLLPVPAPWSCQVTAGPRTMVLPSYCRSQDHGPAKLLPVPEPWSCQVTAGPRTRSDGWPVILDTAVHPF